MPFISEDIAAVILAFKYKNAFWAYHYYIYFRSCTVMLWDLQIKKEAASDAFKVRKAFIYQIFTVSALFSRIVKIHIIAPRLCKFAKDIKP